jgi:hypothetical protein
VRERRGRRLTHVAIQHKDELALRCSKRRASGTGATLAMEKESGQASGRSEAAVVSWRTWNWREPLCPLAWPQLDGGTRSCCRAPSSAHASARTLPGPSLSRQELMLPALAWCGTPFFLSRPQYTMLAARCARQGGSKPGHTVSPGLVLPIAACWQLIYSLYASSPQPCAAHLHVAALVGQPLDQARHDGPLAVVQNVHLFQSGGRRGVKRERSATRLSLLSCRRAAQAAQASRQTMTQHAWPAGDCCTPSSGCPAARSSHSAPSASPPAS